MTSAFPFPTGRLALLLAALATAPCAWLGADEGLWLYEAPPRQWLKERYGFEPTTAWLDHLQKSSVRFNSGGSGSFISADGLLLSNHHIGIDDLQKLSDGQHDYVRDGFYARTRAQEMRCPDLELNVLQSVEDVTARVNAAVGTGLDAEAAYAARRAAIAAIEKASLDQTGLRSDVVTLYEGARFHLYRYQRYTDVRLVFAPQAQIANFGGDPDNFEYPRYDLDICFFRAYEHGQPVKVRDYLQFNSAGVRENELVFVSGHPGDSSRQLTVAELENLRDRQFPSALQRLYRQEIALSTWGARSEENARRCREELLGVQNSRKARDGGLAGLLDPRLLARKQAAESRLRSAVAGSPDLKDTSTAWTQIEQATRVLASNAAACKLLEGGDGFDSTLFDHARTLLRAAEERTKPDGQRLHEFQEANRVSQELALFSTEPLYDDLETLKLAGSLTWLATGLSPTNSLVQQILAGRSPHDRAVELVSGTRVKDLAFRRQLYGASAAEVARKQDPMLALARVVDAESRRLRQIVDTQTEIKQEAYARIAAARLAVGGPNAYPDATFTLRLSVGLVKGYEEDGHAVPFQTTFGGLFARAAEHHNLPPFDLPPLWLKRQGRLDLSTPLNFVCTADILGGNSGSPVVNRAGEFVGIIFDGNIQSLVLDFQFSEEKARAVAVNSQAILAALRRVYDAGALAEEVVGGRARQ